MTFLVLRIFLRSSRDCLGRFMSGNILFPLVFGVVDLDFRVLAYVT
jgi:hypothetical protein